MGIIVRNWESSHCDATTTPPPPPHTRVNLTRWVSPTCNFSLPLPVAVIDGLYELMKVQQGDRLVMVHHLIFDVMGQAFVSLSEGVVVPLYVGHQAVELHKVHCRAGSFSHD